MTVQFRALSSFALFASIAAAAACGPAGTSGGPAEEPSGDDGGASPPDAGAHDEDAQSDTTAAPDGGALPFAPLAVSTSEVVYLTNCNGTNTVSSEVDWYSSVQASKSLQPPNAIAKTAAGSYTTWENLNGVVAQVPDGNVFTSSIVAVDGRTTNIGGPTYPLRGSGANRYHTYACYRDTGRLLYQSPQAGACYSIYYCLPVTGSYTQTCGGCTPTGTSMACSCKDYNGNLRQSAIDLGCTADISNCNGQLTCGGCSTGPTGGSAH